MAGALGEDLTGVAIPVARVAGIALIALGVACWSGPPRVGMLTYSAAVMLYLAYVGFTGGLTGILLWPAAVCNMRIDMVCFCNREKVQVSPLWHRTALHDQ
jgi:hypothetical protein